MSSGEDPRSIGLALQTHALVQDIASKQSAMEAKLGTVAKLVGEDHDTITAMRGTMNDLKASASVTATQSLRMADIAEAREEREAEERRELAKLKAAQLKAEGEASGRRWKILEILAENWKGIAVVIFLFAGVQLEPLMRYFGMAPAQVVHVAAAPSPTPTIIEAPTPLPAPAPE